MKRSANKKEVRRRRVRVLVADEQPVVRLGLVALLDAGAGFQVVAEARSGVEFFAEIERAGPDVAVLDPELHDVRGPELLSELRERHPTLPVLVFTKQMNHWWVVEAVRAGIQGYLIKDAQAPDILEAVRVVGGGGVYLDPRVTACIMDQVGRIQERRRRNSRHLTEREKTVLKLLSQGKRNKEISQLLCISERTVKFHMTALLQKLGAANRTEAVRRAITQGLIRP